MSYKIIDVWMVYDAYDRDIVSRGYFSSKKKAADSIIDKSYSRIQEATIKAILLDNKVYLLGDSIDLDDETALNKEKLIASARRKLTLEELAALKLI